MDQRSLEEVVTNIDARLARVEQILPTLATKEDLKALATRAELLEEGQRTRRHFDVVAERLEAQIQLVAEGQMALRDEMNVRFDGVAKELTQLDRRVMRLEVSRRP